MRDLGLRVIQRRAYKATTRRNNGHGIAPNRVNQQFNPPNPNQLWAGDITYLRTQQGWAYLAVVMDLYSRRIIGWQVSKRMTQDIVIRALKMAITFRCPSSGLIFHSDRGSQYTSKAFKRLLESYDIQQSMSGAGACWDNAVVERFFGSLKHDWLHKAHQPDCDHIQRDVNDYVQYYNHDRLHSANGTMSPVNFELSLSNVSKIA